AQQDPQGRGDAKPADARLRFQLRAGLGLPRPAVGGEIREEDPRPGQKKEAGPGVRIPRQGRPLRRPLVRGPGGGIPPPRRGGVWPPPSTPRIFPAEAQIAREIMKFAQNGTLYRGSKPVMWSVVEQTALAEAEIEYEDYVSDQVWVKFPIVDARQDDLNGASILIWTTTPWTIPGNRAISFSPKIKYGLYEVVDAPEGNWAKVGDKFVLADKLAADVFQHARVAKFKRLRDVNPIGCGSSVHPLKAMGYDFLVPILAGD